MSRGIIELVQLAAALVLAVPVGLLGVRFLTGGETVLGVVFLAMAVGMVAIEELVVTPRDLPGLLVEKAVGRVAKDPDE